MNRKLFLKNASLTVIGSLFLPSIFKRGIVKASVADMIKPAEKPSVENWRDNEINIAWIGHATILINFYGKYILTDPVFFEAVGIYLDGYILGPRRVSLPALMIDEVPKPDVVLISHAHMDHMDYKTLKALTMKYPDELDCILAYNTKDVIDDLKWKSLQEVDWEERISLNGINFKGIEVKHTGWRYPGEKDRSAGYFKDGRSYNGYILERNGKKILFGGDTAFTDIFKNQREENVDIAIMPIGGYKPHKENHCNPEEALVMAVYYLGAKYFIPMHTKTFDGGEMIYEPLIWLNKSISNYRITLGLNDIGETFTFKA